MRVIILCIFVCMCLAFTRHHVAMSENNCQSDETPCNMGNYTACCGAVDACCCPDELHCCTNSSEACVCKGICPGPTCVCYACQPVNGVCHPYCAHA